MTRVGAALLGTRWLVRAPIWIYRARLGFLFGRRLLMLEHLGRRSGRRRYVVLEIVDHPAAGSYVVISGFGTRAQWFRNVQANPRVRLYVASGKPAPATARLLDATAAAESLNRYAIAHPRSWATLRPVLERTLDVDITECGTELPMIALEITP